MKFASKRVPTKLRLGKRNPSARIRAITRAKTSGQKVGKQQAQKMFVNWVQRNDPFIYKASRRVALMRGQNLNGMGAIDWGNLFQSTVDTIKTALPTYYQTRQQKELIKIQTDRAKQGLPPLETSQYTAPITIAPVLTPDTEAAMNRVAIKTVEGGIGKMMPWLLGGGALLFLFLRKK